MKNPARSYPEALLPFFGCCTAHLPTSVCSPRGHRAHGAGTKGTGRQRAHEQSTRMERCKYALKNTQRVCKQVCKPAECTCMRVQALSTQAGSERMCAAPAALLLAVGARLCTHPAATCACLHPNVLLLWGLRDLGDPWPGLLLTDGQAGCRATWPCGRVPLVPLAGARCHLVPTWSPKSHIPTGNLQRGSPRGDPGWEHPRVGQTPAVPSPQWAPVPHPHPMVSLRPGALGATE